MSKPPFTQLHRAAMLLEMCRKRPGELRDLMEGESKFTLPNSDSGAPVAREDSQAWIEALYHVRFAARYGDVKERIFDGKHWQSAFPEEFEHWVKIGAPGLNLEELESYLAEFPLSGKTGGGCGGA